MILKCGTDDDDAAGGINGHGVCIVRAAELDGAAAPGFSQGQAIEIMQKLAAETLPDGFQRSEFLLEHGAIDMIVDRREMRDRLASLIPLLLRQPAAA